MGVGRSGPSYKDIVGRMVSSPFLKLVVEGAQAICSGSLFQEGTTTEAKKFLRGRDL